jgi:cobalt-zinc-cadmium efflux system protein
MAHAHDHSHHDHGPANYNRSFGIGIALNLSFVAIEAIYGVRAHSMALVADSGHNLSDVLGLVLAWGASVLVQRLPSTRFTYGLRRGSVLAAAINAILLLVSIGAVAWEAIKRLGEPGPIGTGTMIVVATIGIGVNGATALLFRVGRERDLNIRGAYLHMAADALVSVGVVAAGFTIGVTGWLWLDPVVSLVIAAIVVYGTWSLLRASVNLALDAVPEHIDATAVAAYLAALPGVTEVHDLHIWAMSTTEAALTAHIVRPTGLDEDATLRSICRQLHDHYGIEHATIQVERGGECHPCGLALAKLV